jgi:hypothetical protein
MKRIEDDDPVVVEARETVARMGGHSAHRRPGWLVFDGDAEPSLPFRPALELVDGEALTASAARPRRRGGTA